MTTIKNRKSRVLCSAALIVAITGVGNTAFAHDSDKIVPRVGLKSVEVVRNDLRLLGVSPEYIEIIDESEAQVGIWVDDNPAYFSVDRESGVIDISKSSPATQEFLQLHVPPMQLFPVPEPGGATLRAVGLVGIALLAAWKRRGNRRSC